MSMILAAVGLAVSTIVLACITAAYIWNKATKTADTLPTSWKIAAVLSAIGFVASFITLVF